MTAVVRLLKRLRVLQLPFPLQNVRLDAHVAPFVPVSREVRTCTDGVLDLRVLVCAEGYAECFRSNWKREMLVRLCRCASTVAGVAVGR